MKISRAVTKRHKVTQTREVLLLILEHRNAPKRGCFQCNSELGDTCGLAFTKLGLENLCNTCIDKLEKKYPKQFNSEIVFKEKTNDTT